MLGAAVKRQQQVQRRFNPAVANPNMRAGECAGGCNCNACPGGGAEMSVNEIANLLGRRVAGLSGRCKYQVLHLTNEDRATGIAPGATELLELNAQVGMCLQQVVVVGRDVAVPDTERSFVLSNLSLANEPQWLNNRLYHSALFRFDAECSCCLPGDCTTIGTLVSISATNTGADDANIDVYLLGPGT